MFGLLITVHVITCLLLIFIVLLQSGKGAELGAAFGGMGQASTVRGVATFLNKFTTVLAIVFMLTSLGLALMSTEKAKSSATDAQPITSTNSTNSVEDTNIPVSVSKETSSTSQENSNLKQDKIEIPSTSQENSNSKQDKTETSSTSQEKTK